MTKVAVGIIWDPSVLPLKAVEDLPMVVQLPVWVNDWIEARIYLQDVYKCFVIDFTIHDTCG